MTKRLEQGIDAVRDLPAERRDLAGEVLLAIARQSGRAFRLSAEHIEDVKLALADADRGDFATSEEIENAWKNLSA